ncbi:AFR147Cp [Eremothecium gossypii ATCC 10895]|uniref:AFR147Cp n=1 Tax=Eremothecium gossypii (strain ATCC 10895 / CBS 109.51 / FGSC 9923 / NRRL Y-1056) TaxID=284811 RepID=Q754C3_EREGS|nr:AFR147Cp [Eremothecium gossypii ATCC 10895]AAS53518.2 AFR147Cp [Eremothecium gossypii ATCC 10895]AEY97830.1 FAFR147Cp [Eremothecium gossypii FDAG1]
MTAQPSNTANPAEVDELVHAVAGAGGGALSMALTMPLVTLATRMQVSEQDKEPGTRSKSKLEAVREIYRKEGVVGFYAGLESAMYGMAVNSFIYYYFYELAARATMRVRGSRRLNTSEAILSSAVAGSMTAIASNPIWVVNTRMTVAKSEQSTLAVLLDIVRKDGVTALFNGLRPALMLVSNPIIQYTVFEQLKNVVLKWSGSDVLLPSWAFLLGAVGKLAATGSTYPYITLKTRMHLAKGKEDADTQQSMWSLMVDIVKKEGIQGLYHGIGVKLTQSILTAAFLFYFKEGFILWAVKLISTLRRYSSRRKAVSV